MFFHRGSWVSEKSVQSVSDLFRSNESNYGTTAMQEQETSSWQRFYPNEKQRFGYGYDCTRFARDAASKDRGRKPVIVEFQVPDAETYAKYSKYLKLILKRGHETDISQDSSLVTVNAIIVSASEFSFDDFLKYKGELLVDSEITETGIRMVEELQCTLYESRYNTYNEFAQAYNEGTVKPLYKTEDILREVSRSSIEGNIGLNT